MRDSSLSLTRERWRLASSFLLLSLGSLIIAHLLDGWFYANFRMANVYGDDWGRALRVLGFLPLWWIAALALALEDRVRLGYSRAALLAGAPTLAGIAGELLKLILRRERPYANDGDYVFRSFTERPFSTGGLALPSSHALIAFAAAAILARLFPRARVIWWAMAWGCGLTRVAAGAHFLSDIVLAALVGWLTAWALWRKRPRTEDPLVRQPRSEVAA